LIKVVQRLFRLLLVLLACFSSRALYAAESGAELSISLLTMGPGAHPFTKFGHSALWVHDGLAQTDEVYNYGTFAFDAPTALLDSVQGKLPYWLSVQSMSGTVRTYRGQGRSLLASELELTPAERAQLRAALRENARPEHRYYRYDYYRDNCSTRVRDIVDLAIGGRMRRAATETGSMSYRAHTQRLVADDKLLYVGLDLAVGRETDTPVTFWDEGWLPERLHELFARTVVSRDGRTLPLIRSERTLLTSRFAAPRSTPPSWLGYYAGVGLALGLSFVALGSWAQPGRRAPRLVLGALYVALGLTLGLLGAALCYLTFFSAHSAAASNYNVLLLPPWLLALGVAGVGVMRGQASAFRVVRWAAWGALLSSALALLIHGLSKNPQANLQELAVALPLWLGVVLSTRRTAEAANARKPLTLLEQRESGVERA
jgi:uncharacterized protein DUF4105